MKGCSIEPDPEVTEARMECGLVRGHAYSITKVLNAKIETPQVSGIIKQKISAYSLENKSWYLHCDDKNTNVTNL